MGNDGEGAWGFWGFFLGFWELGVYLFIYFMYSHLFSSIFLLFPSWGFGFVGFGIDGCKGEFFFFFSSPSFLVSFFLFFSLSHTLNFQGGLLMWI